MAKWIDLVKDNISFAELPDGYGKGGRVFYNWKNKCYVAFNYETMILVLKDKTILNYFANTRSDKNIISKILDQVYGKNNYSLKFLQYEFEKDIRKLEEPYFTRVITHSE